MKNKKYIIWLDVLKIIAASFIVFHHYQLIFSLRFNGINFYDGTLYVGYFVELFFIISGFLTLYTDKKAKVKQAFLHKLLRIFPITTIACAFTLIVKSIHAENISNLWGIKSLAANFLLIFSGYPFFSMIGYNNPTWYLCILIQCYFIYYLIRFISEKSGIKRIWYDLAAIASAFILHHFTLLADSSYRGIEAFSIGLILNGISEKIPRKRVLPLILLCLSIGASVIIPYQQRRIMTFITFPALVLLCVWAETNFNENLKRTINTLGKVSFEVYIWHYPLMAVEQMITRILDYDIERNYLTMVIFLIVIWIISYLLFQYIENPINHFFKETSYEKSIEKE